MEINGVEVSEQIILPLREATTSSMWDTFWDSVSANLKERILSTDDDKLSALKNKISHVEELRGLFRGVFEHKQK